MITDENKELFFQLIFFFYIKMSLKSPKPSRLKSPKKRRRNSTKRSRRKTPKRIRSKTTNPSTRRPKKRKRRK